MLSIKFVIWVIFFYYYLQLTVHTLCHNHTQCTWRYQFTKHKSLKSTVSESWCIKMMILLYPLLNNSVFKPFLQLIVQCSLKSQLSSKSMCQLQLHQLQSTHQNQLHTIMVHTVLTDQATSHMLTTTITRCPSFG